MCYGLVNISAEYISAYRGMVGSSVHWYCVRRGNSAIVLVVTSVFLSTETADDNIYPHRSSSFIIYSIPFTVAASYSKVQQM